MNGTEFKTGTDITVFSIRITYVEDVISNKQRQEEFINKLGWGNCLPISEEKFYLTLYAKVIRGELKFKDKNECS